MPFGHYMLIKNVDVSFIVGGLEVVQLIDRNQVIFQNLRNSEVVSLVKPPHKLGLLLEEDLMLLCTVLNLGILPRQFSVNEVETHVAQSLEVVNSREVLAVMAVPRCVARRTDESMIRFGDKVEVLVHILLAESKVDEVDVPEVGPSQTKVVGLDVFMEKAALVDFLEPQYHLLHEGDDGVDGDLLVAEFEELSHVRAQFLHDQHLLLEVVLVRRQVPRVRELPPPHHLVHDVLLALEPFALLLWADLLHFDGELEIGLVTNPQIDLPKTAGVDDVIQRDHVGQTVVQEL